MLLVSYKHRIDNKIRVKFTKKIDDFGYFCLERIKEMSGDKNPMLLIGS